VIIMPLIAPIRIVFKYLIPTSFASIIL